MADSEREDSYYVPGGIPITPQARRFGYEFPVYVSKAVWREVCITPGVASKHGTTPEQRIWRLLQFCYDGMSKKLAAEDNFLSYQFKVHYWNRRRPKAKKMSRVSLSARLFLDPSTDGPWLYISNPQVDSITALTQGTGKIFDSASDNSQTPEQSEDSQQSESHPVTSEPDDQRST